MSADATASSIYARLADRYCLADGWITMAEVQPHGCTRRFDALSIMAWGSRGHEALGFEIKVSRSDWLRELKDVGKADPLVSLCTRWWICAPPGVVEKAEMPVAWGLLVFHENRVVAAKQAARLTPEPWTPEQWRCLMLRLATRKQCERTEVERARDKGYSNGYDAGLKLGADSAAKDRKRINELERVIGKAEAASGVPLTNWTDFRALGVAMRLIGMQGLPYLADQMAKAASDLSYLAAQLGARADAAE